VRIPFLPVTVFCCLAPGALAIAIAWIQVGQQAEFVARQTNRRLESIATLNSARALTDEDIRRLAEQAGVRATLIDVTDEPVVVSDSSRDVDSASLQADDVFNARRTGLGHLRQPIAGVDWTFVAILVTDPSNAATRVLRVSAPTMSGRGSVQTNQVPAAMWRSIWFWSAVLLTSATVAVVALLSAVRQQRQLRRMERSLHNLREIPPDAVFNVRTTGKLPELSEAFLEAATVLHREFEEQQSRTRELETSARFLETVLRSMIEGVIALDGSHRIVFANDAAGPLLDSTLSGSGLRGLQILEVIRHQTLDQTLSNVLSGQDRVQAEFKLPRSNRSISIFGTRLTDGKQEGAVLVLQDVTELRRLENMRREFVSNVSHELKTPLASIQAYAETLANGALNDPDAGPRFLNRISEQADNLHELIQDVLNLSRIETGKEAFQIRDVSVAETILGSVDEHQPLAGAKGITIELDSDNTDLFVRADAGGFRTIIDNLLSNAVKYTPDSGSVRIQWGLVDQQVRIDVIDSGVGIPPEQVGRIFERFYRVDEARSRDVGGTGLGLSIVKHLAQVFGGQVTVDSHPGKGSTFTVELQASLFRQV